MRRTLIALFCAMVTVVGVVSPAGADVGEPEGVGLHDPSTGI